MKNKPEHLILKIIVLSLAIIYVLKFASDSVLKTYIEIGIGNCKNLPLLCKSPDSEIINPQINPVYIKKLQPFKLDEIEICAPQNFTVIKEKIRKAYYKKERDSADANRDTIYLLYEGPGFFMNLFPRLKQRGVKDDYEFLTRTMYAQTNKISGFTDTFFVIIKSIFIPNLGNFEKVVMLKYSAADKKGYINYSLDRAGNYFDCNLIDAEEHFFKIYIINKSADLSLEDVFSIISTIRIVE
ncbi:MAG: hypothetical protein DRP74_05670 [Candidatus Omnitrophota bacterium]|nr:MAG: hypothetical protein DRP74_05670 [Candidatus Omnitrophota bacterium]